MIDLGVELLQHLENIVVARAPYEAVGIICDDQVIELPNRHLDPEHNFLITKNDIKTSLVGISGIDYYEMVLWHSHPAGLVGPSRVDMKQKTAFPYHLVLSLQGSDLIPTWY